MDKSIVIVGGPFPQQVDPVLQLVPTGRGNLAAAIADEFERQFTSVRRIGNFSGGEPCSFEQLQTEIKTLNANVVVFLPHLPNVLVEPSPTKLRLADGEEGMLQLRPAPKLVQRIKPLHPEVLLVPFKLADVHTSRVEIVKWMLELHSALAVYSRLGESGQYYVIDALANEVAVSRAELPKVLVETVSQFLKAVRRRSKRVSADTPSVPHLDKLVAFSRKMQPAFSQIIERNVASGRWPGNFSFRCTHGFLSSRAEEGFIITRRNVAKTGLTTQDFVWVSLDLDDGSLTFSGTDGIKPSIDSPVHRVIYQELPWVQSIVHGHLQVFGNCVHPEKLRRWPCGAENEGYDIAACAPKESEPELWVANVEGHGFVALIGNANPEAALDKLSALQFEAN